MTKKELLAHIDQLSDDLRRLGRDVKHLSLDVQSFKGDRARPSRKAYPTEGAEIAIRRALEEWNLNVTEPGGGGASYRIDPYIRGPEGLGWTWEDEYKRNGQFAWCGAFAAYAYGPALDYQIRHKIFASCYRLFNTWGRTAHCRDHESIMIGDVITVWTSSDQSLQQGNHIVIALSVPDLAGVFETIEGNAKGAGPDADWREGVSRRTRDIKNVAHIYRLLEEDFNER